MLALACHNNIDVNNLLKLTKPYIWAIRKARADVSIPSLVGFAEKLVMVDDSSYLENVTLLGSPLLWFAEIMIIIFVPSKGTNANCAYITLKKLEQLYPEGQLKG